MKATLSNWLKTRWGKRTAWAIVALLVYSCVGFVLVPWIVGKVIPKRTSEFLGREVTIEKIRINPFVLSGSFRGLLVEDTDGTALLSWDEVYGNFQLSSIFRRAFTFKEIRVVKPYIHLQVNPDNSLNISDILKQLEEESEATPSDDEGGVLPLRVERLTLTNAVARLSDLTLREPFHRQIGPVSLILKKFHTDPDNENPYAFEGTTDAGERFSWSGRFFLSPFRSEGKLAVENIRIPNYAPLYQDFVSFKVDAGVINLSSDYHLRHDGTDHNLVVSNAMFHLASFKVAADRETTEHALEVGDLRVSGVEADLRNRAARVGSIALERGELCVQRNKDASINLVEMAKPSDTNAQPAGAVLYAIQAATNFVATFLNTTNRAVAVIDSLDVNEWALQLKDDTLERPVRLRIDGITVRGKNLSNIPGDHLSLGMECRWNTNGTIRVDAGGKLFPMQSEVRLEVDRIELPPLDPYTAPFANVLLRDGTFSMEGTLQIQQTDVNAPLTTRFEAGLSLDDLWSVDGSMGTDLLSWKSLQVSDILASLHPVEVSIGQISIHDARARLVVETNRTINLMNALQVGDRGAPGSVPEQSAQPESVSPLSSTATSKEQDGAPPTGSVALKRPTLTVSSVVISNAAVDVRDESTEPPLRWSLTDVQGQIGGFSSTHLEQADLEMTAKAGGTAPVEILGRLNPLNPDLDTDLTVILNAMDLLPFSPWAGRYAGYMLRQGSLSLDLQYSIEGQKLDAENLIVLDQLSLGQKVESPEATSLPVKLGVAVLKDRNGLIELDIPIEGDLNDPGFRLDRVIGSTLMNTLTKMLSSPFSLLGGLVGGNAEEMSTIQFAPGSSALATDAIKGLQKLCKALYERPGLEVEIQGSVSPEGDGLAIKKQKLYRQLQQVRWEELRESAQATMQPEDIQLSPDLRIAALRKRYVQVFPDEARSSRPPPGLEESFYKRMTNKLLEEIEVTEEDFHQLAKHRAQAVKVYLVEQGGVGADRLFLTEETNTAQEGSKVLLQLQ